MPDRCQEWVQSGLFSRLWQGGLKDYAREVGIEGSQQAYDKYASYRLKDYAREIGIEGNWQPGRC